MMQIVESVGANDPAVQCDFVVRCSEITPTNSDQSPTSREGHVAFAVGSSIYFFGGGRSTSTGPVQSNDLYSFDLGTTFIEDKDSESKTWTQVQTQGTSPTPRTGSASVFIDGKLYLFGGFNNETGLRIRVFSHYHSMVK